MQAYLINLPNALERRKYVLENLKKIKNKVIIIEGIIGKNLVLPHKDFNEFIYKFIHGKNTNFSELGCYFSHIKALEAFLATSDSHALILEDDISITDDLEQIMGHAIKYSEYWDILRLSGLHKSTNLKITNLYKHYNLVSVLTQQTGAGAYIVNRKAAENLIKKLLPMKLPYDHAFDKDWITGLHTLFVDPLPISQSSPLESQILPTKKNKKLGIYRYLSVFPYRTYNEIFRFFYRLFHYVKLKLLLSLIPKDI